MYYGSEWKAKGKKLTRSYKIIKWKDKEESISIQIKLDTEDEEREGWRWVIKYISREGARKKIIYIFIYFVYSVKIEGRVKYESWGVEGWGWDQDERLWWWSKDGGWRRRMKGEDDKLIGGVFDKLE